MDLMTAKPTGVLSLINEEVLVPNSSDANLLQKLLQQHRSSVTPRGTVVFKALPRAQGEGFIVQHYAGPVGYLIEGFVDKNRDTLPGELTQLLSASSMPLLEAIFKPGGGGGGGDPAAADQGAKRGGGRGRPGGGKRTAALASQFAESLEALMAVLRSTTPHFVRCVKPNPRLRPDDLDGAYVMCAAAPPRPYSILFALARPRTPAPPCSLVSILRPPLTRL